MDAPSRGHDLKRCKGNQSCKGSRDAPSRGHDLKQCIGCRLEYSRQDAPSRGHDLKPVDLVLLANIMMMPPHGGMT